MWSIWFIWHAIFYLGTFALLKDLSKNYLKVNNSIEIINNATEISFFVYTRNTQSSITNPIRRPRSFRHCSDNRNWGGNFPAGIDSGVVCVRRQITRLCSSVETADLFFFSLRTKNFFVVENFVSKFSQKLRFQLIFLPRLFI